MSSRGSERRRLRVAVLVVSASTAGLAACLGATDRTGLNAGEIGVDGGRPARFDGSVATDDSGGGSTSDAGVVVTPPDTEWFLEGFVYSGAVKTLENVVTREVVDPTIFGSPANETQSFRFAQKVKLGDRFDVQVKNGPQNVQCNRIDATSDNVTGPPKPIIFNCGSKAPVVMQFTQIYNDVVVSLCVNTEPCSEETAGTERRSITFARKLAVGDAYKITIKRTADAAPRQTCTAVSTGEGTVTQLGGIVSASASCSKKTFDLNVTVTDGGNGKRQGILVVRGIGSATANATTDGNGVAKFTGIEDGTAVTATIRSNAGGPCRDAVVTQGTTMNGTTNLTLDCAPVPVVEDAGPDGEVDAGGD